MKFAIAVVMLALAVGVHSSLYAGHFAPAVSYVTSAIHPAGPYHGYHGYGPGPYAYGGHYGPAAVAVHHDGGHGWGHSGPAHWGGYPGISLSQGPHAAHAAPLALAHGHGHGHEGVYVAKTRGAVHTAPLAGHINSATSINVAPAPGTH